MNTYIWKMYAISIYFIFPEKIICGDKNPEHM